MGSSSNDLKLPPFPALRRGARLWLAYSGGLDSTALLHLLAATKLPRVEALHVHHGLQPAADGWAKRCVAQCRALGVPCTVLKVQIEPGDPAGPEAAAREARYAALAARMQIGDLLITAHHQDDQAETVLLRLLRGAGVSGLAAMEPLRAFGPGRLWRPLLQTSRAAILSYAQGQGLAWIEDPHNLNPRFARSYLRAEIMPRLLAQWPQAAASLARAARHAGEADALLSALAQSDLEAMGGSEGGGATLSVAALLKLERPRRANLLRYWLGRQGLLAPPSAMLERLDSEVLRARADGQPLLRGEAYEFRRYRDELHVMPLLPPAPQARLEWDGTGTLVLPEGCGKLVSSARKAQTLSVRFARGGEKLKPAGSAHTRTLKQLFQEGGVPPWQRQRMPLIYRGDELLSVADRWRDMAWAQELQRKRARIRWLPAWD